MATPGCALTLGKNRPGRQRPGSVPSRQRGPRLLQRGASPGADIDGHAALLAHGPRMPDPRHRANGVVVLAQAFRLHAQRDYYLTGEVTRAEEPVAARRADRGG